MSEQYDMDELLSHFDFSSGQLQDIGNGMFLTNHEIEVLKRYDIPYQKCHSLKELTFLIEDLLEDMDDMDEELDLVSSSISERDYYQNTEK